MVIKEDGTKWACQSCLKGHRVSGCTHTDRELTLVPKKGRPVTQCHHCRAERKKRSAHVKCDCGETDKPHHSKEKCIHLREAEERAKAGFHDDQLATTTALNHDKDVARLAAVAEEQGCCCHHGGKCSCALIKKDPDKGRDLNFPHRPAVPKPRLESTKSDGSLTVFANGHHKPVHRKNHAAHECGMPYKMPLQRTSTDGSYTITARRSVDSLAIDTSASINAMAFPPLQSATRPSERSLSLSEESSPRGCSTNNASIAGLLPPMDFNALRPNANDANADTGVGDTMIFPPFEPMSAVADATQDPWSFLPSADATSYPNNNPFGVWATNFDAANTAQPALTAASSGTQSEIDEIPPMDELYGLQMPSIQEDLVGMAMNTPIGNEGVVNRRSLPPGFFGNTDFSTSSWGSDWQTGMADGMNPGDNKSRQSDNGQVYSNINDAWPTPTMPSMTATVQRTSVSPFFTGRPQSLSIGPGSAPPDDMLKQLFPDIDVSGAAFDGGASPTPMDFIVPRRALTMPTNNDMSNTSAFPRLDGEPEYVSQRWTDGSMSVPVPFSENFELDVDLINTEFSGGWQQQ